MTCFLLLNCPTICWILLRSHTISLKTSQYPFSTRLIYKYLDVGIAVIICLNTVESGDLIYLSSAFVASACILALFLVSSLFNTRVVPCLQLRLCLHAQTAQALSQLLDHSAYVSLIYLCFNLKQCLMINYSTVGGMRYIKREERILYSRIIRLVTFNLFIDKIFTLPFDSRKLTSELRSTPSPLLLVRSKKVHY